MFFSITQLINQFWIKCFTFLHFHQDSKSIIQFTNLHQQILTYCQLARFFSNFSLSNGFQSKHSSILMNMLQYVYKLYAQKPLMHSHKIQLKKFSQCFSTKTLGSWRHQRAKKFHAHNWLCADAKYFLRKLFSQFFFVLNFTWIQTKTGLSRNWLVSVKFQDF